MRNFIHANKYKILIAFLCVATAYLVFSYTSGVFINGRASNGFSYLKKDKETLEFYGYYAFYNITPFTKMVEISASSQRDVESSLLATPELEIISIESDGYSKISELGASIILEPFSETYIVVIAAGKYGGNGNGDKHGAKISIESTCCPHMIK